MLTIEATTLRLATAALLTAIAGFLPGVAAAHPGGLNAEGCHNNRKTGEYHCHRGAEAGSSNRGGASRAASVAAVSPGGAGASTAGGCFTGPRGGTYTITASGRKNYGGC